ncbi:DUF6898 family protein [Pararhodospirillum oryzae]|uniref:DUF6898 domain-containing protein n=1 Tax=Pararhodospirillum oryzae TaxID=478448 RepID=A0A512HAI6_9PROT|nr:hypothetical protein [Pararhodospirillum oryzae]GEO82467.1 hypothetical protein ROR02_25980 [Pararhodospirillum oryzae]
MPTPPCPPAPPREVLFEIRQAGAYMRVAALDAATGTEVVMVGPASASLTTLKQNAARKLAYVLARRPASR